MNISLACILVCCLFLGCKQTQAPPTPAQIRLLELKRGALVSCGPPGMQLGIATFETSCHSVQDDFNLGIKLLHSFEYDEAEKVFAGIIDKEPGCAMGYWGIAMSNFHPLWAPPTPDDLKKGARAIAFARSLTASGREKDYIAAIGAYYDEWETTGHRIRAQRFETAMKALADRYPRDRESTIFYALALNAAADPTDKSFRRQLKAGQILEALYPGQPEHPGIVHYLIHTYDYPQLAQRGLAAARKYASIAPSSAHALHMPSHIFTRLGLWDEMIRANLASVASAVCYADAIGLKGHWDEELHGLDYLIYGYLQKGQNDSAAKQLEYVRQITKVEPSNFKVAYAFAAMPARYVLENRQWKAAATLKPASATIPWGDFPWQAAIVHFARALGSAHTGQTINAREELNILNRLQARLISQKDTYASNQVAIQAKAAEAWITLKEGKSEAALALMQLAADMEDKTGKHPVTPGEVLPARELLGDLLLEMNRPEAALAAYEADLLTHPNRFNALYGAGQAALKCGKTEKAHAYFQQLLTITDNGRSPRPEIARIKTYLKQSQTTSATAMTSGASGIL
ncbi:hypothetical protein LL912_22925 [Niabella sp. CC-SYL272]|uniref:hypothetical protein n=1 Tax=Niabella agricola TaxID=2891571 RepID=UPI001F4194CC|nr:hypothetical protein [Niabella agricola]MCF3111659.1 hypothetical protein [Niabella agricola]